MDKYEYKLRLEEIKTLNRKGRFQEAAQVADTIDWKKVRNISTLGIISDVYKVNRRFEDAKEILLLASIQSPQNRRILYSLCDLTIKMGQVVEAVEYYKEFVQIAPNDNSKYILLYKIYEAQDISLDERIAVLKEYKKREYSEKWAYELANLYSRVGLATECVEECDQLILWFGEGKYVAKAMELKMRYVTLSPAQQQAYDRMFGGRRAVQEEEKTAAKEEKQTIADSAVVKEIPGKEEELDIQVKPMDMGQYNTLNLQAALAESMKEVLEPQQEKAEAQAAVFWQQEDTAEREGQQQEVAESRQTKEHVGIQPEAGMRQIEQTVQETQMHRAEQVIQEPDVRQKETVLQGQQPAYGGDDAEYQEDVSRVMQDSAKWDVQVTGQLELEESGADIRQESERMQESSPRQTDGHVHEQGAAKPGIERLLAQEYDGQISLALPEEKTVEKQITGQMNIEDVLAEWERLKKKNEEKRRQETKQWMLQQTGSLFDDFDQLSRDGVLEKLQREESLPIEDIQKRRYEDPSVQTTVEELEEIEENAAEEESCVTAEQEEGIPVGRIPQADTAVAQPKPANAAARAVMAAQGMLEELPGAAAKEQEAEESSQQAQLSEEEQKRMAAEALLREAEEKQRAAQALILELKREKETAQQSEMEPEKETEAAEPLVKDSQEPEEATMENSISSVQQEPVSDIQKQEQNEEQEQQPGTKQATERTEEPKQPESQERENAAEDTSAVSGNTETLHERIAEQQIEEHERSMTQEEKELFAQYVPTKATMRQLVKALDTISLSAYTGNMIISGAAGSDMMKLAKSVIRKVRSSDHNFSGKIARISGDVLNSRNVEGVINRISNGALIIERGSKLSDEGVLNLVKALNQEQTGIIVFLLDTKRAIAGLLERNPQLAECFTARFDIEALDTATLVKYGCQYAYNMEFSIDELGRLALHTRIEDMQTRDHTVNVDEVREIIDDAIAHAERFSLRHFMDILFRKRYDEDDMIILRERDFI